MAETGAERDLTGAAAWVPYLEKLGLTEPPPVSVAGLTALHRAQVFRIPFENLAILLGDGVDVGLPAIFNKVVLTDRGGYCFELNGLLLGALRAFGFDARPLLGRVHVGGEPSGRTHQVSEVRIDGSRYLADVGFGAASPHSPIPMVTEQTFEQDGRIFRLGTREPYGVMLQLVDPQGAWQDLYSLDGTHVCHADIETGNHYTSTSPKSFFTTTPIAALHSATGRTVLFGHDLQVSDASGDTAIELPRHDGYVDALATYFGIRLQATYETLFDR